MSNNLLNKKTTRDRFSISKQVNNTGNNNNNNGESNSIINKRKSEKKSNNNIPKDPGYEKEYKRYISIGFSMQSFILITKLVNYSSAFTPEAKNNNNLHSLMQKTVKQLLMNEIEIALYSLYLEKYPFSQSTLQLKDHLLIIGLSAKKYCNKNTQSIENFLNVEYPTILDLYAQWTKDQKEPITVNAFELNERYNQLKSPSNTYCKNNFIDYNESVDQILQMSLPYKEGNKNKDPNQCSGINERNYYYVNDDNEHKGKDGKIHKVNFRVLKPREGGFKSLKPKKETSTNANGGNTGNAVIQEDNYKDNENNNNNSFTTINNGSNAFSIRPIAKSEKNSSTSSNTIIDNSHHIKSNNNTNNFGWTMTNSNVNIFNNNQIGFNQHMLLPNANTDNTPLKFNQIFISRTIPNIEDEVREFSKLQSKYSDLSLANNNNFLLHKNPTTNESLSQCISSNNHSTKKTVLIKTVFSDGCLQNKDKDKDKEKGSDNHYNNNKSQ